MAPYRIYQIVRNENRYETRGQCWVGETVAENLELCPYQTILPTFLKHLPRTGRILESGCGLGRWVFYFRRQGYDVTGIDLSQSAVEQALEYDPSVPIQVDDVVHSKFPDRHFSAAISLGVVEHFEEGPQMALRELHRLLEEDGVLFISVPVQNMVRRVLVNRLKDLFRWFRRRRGAEFVFEEYRFSVGQFTGYLEEAGFEPIEIVADDFLPPLNLGLYSDFQVLHSRTKKWALNPAGRAIRSVLHALSPWTICAGALWVCRKRRSSPPEAGRRPDPVK